VYFGLIPFVGILAVLGIVSLKDMRSRLVIGISALVLVVGLVLLQAKVWGVIMMGLSLVLFFFLPYLDRSPVKSIRYRGWMFKTALAIFVVTFFVLGYLGTKSPEIVSLFWMKNVYWVQIFTIVYFAFFLFMPWYTTFDKTKPVPERVTQ
jgi:ubiquinol-cytochrome c reductase cytochrome b subunit